MCTYLLLQLFCTCVITVQKYKCTACFFFLLVCPWPDPYFSQKRWMMPRHTLNPYYGWFRLALFSKVSNFKPETCILVLGSSFNFKEPPNSSSLNISESKNHRFSSLKKNNPESKNYWFQLFQETSKNRWFSLKNSSKELMGSSTNFFYLYFFRTTVIHQNWFIHQNLRIGR